MKRRSLLSFAAAFTALLALAACSNSNGAADGGTDAIPVSCGATQDCITVGLDADSCVYLASANGCAGIGQCREVDTATCTKQVVACACSGGTQTFSECSGGYSPIPFESLGPCPGDGGP